MHDTTPDSPGQPEPAVSRAADGPGPIGPGRYLPRLMSELIESIVMQVFRFLADWVLFPDGEMFSVLRGRLYSLVFGWGHGVRVDRFVTFRDIRTIRIGRHTGIRREVVLKGPLTIGELCWIGDRTMIYP